MCSSMCSCISPLTCSPPTTFVSTEAAGSASGLVRPRAKMLLQESAGPAQKQPKTGEVEDLIDDASSIGEAPSKNDKNPTRDALLVQLGARVRRLEHAAFSTATGAIGKSFQDYLKQRKNDQNKCQELAGPASQALFRKSSRGRPLQVQEYFRSSPLEVAAWVRRLVALPTHEKPSTEQTSRITPALHGNILLPCEDEVAAELEQKLKDAVEEGGTGRGKMRRMKEVMDLSALLRRRESEGAGGELSDALPFGKKAGGVAQLADDADDAFQAVEWALRSKDLQHAIDVCVKMAYQRAQQLRDLAASGWPSAAPPAKSAAVEAGRAADKQYPEAVLIAEVKPFLGPPHLHIARAAFKSLAESDTIRTQVPEAHSLLCKCYEQLILKSGAKALGLMRRRFRLNKVLQGRLHHIAVLGSGSDHAARQEISVAHHMTSYSSCFVARDLPHLDVGRVSAIASGLAAASMGPRVVGCVPAVAVRPPWPRQAGGDARPSGRGSGARGSRQGRVGRFYGSPSRKESPRRGMRSPLEGGSPELWARAAVRRPARHSVFGSAPMLWQHLALLLLTAGGRSRDQRGALRDGEALRGNAAAPQGLAVPGGPPRVRQEPGELRPQAARPQRRAPRRRKADIDPKYLLCGEGDGAFFLGFVTGAAAVHRGDPSGVIGWKVLLAVPEGKRVFADGSRIHSDFPQLCSGDAGGPAALARARPAEVLERCPLLRPAPPQFIAPPPLTHLTVRSQGVLAVQRVASMPEPPPTFALILLAPEHRDQAEMAPRARQARSSLFAYAALAALAAQLLVELHVADFADGEALAAFAVPGAPAVSTQVEAATAGQLTRRAPSAFEMAAGRAAGGATARAAAAPAVSVVSKVVNAMGAGAVASVIQAALSAVGEPIVNRVLVKRMKIMEAINDVSAAQMLNFFKTTLATNFLKFPFFEAINAFCGAFPISPTYRGIFTGFVFTTATLPVTNYRYRKSMELEVNWGNIYEAYPPTVIRDIVYGIARNYCTIGVLALNSTWTAASPEVLFIVVILGCLISAPFNEWRGFLLQSKGQELTFKEFFKPSNFVRSTSLGAIKQGLALALGYWAAPPATKFVKGLIMAAKGA
ncbi:unnamed protein product [Prorocentrum cordatum]|uniref:Uncharacterized protein n=1 Tax=Prorocentrum cordatum TaxID=2364126 RepID=A0ABN9T9D8_9DINO|nr:unnamed protein product [Polarella glacialis]